jgi:hypothetical protein
VIENSKSIGSVPRELPVDTYQRIRMLDPKLAKEMRNYSLRVAATNAGYPLLTDWHPVIPEGWGEFAHLDFQRNCVYRGNRDSWAYSHHPSIVRFQDKYVTSWSNGFRHEDYIGQEVHYSWSTDAVHWATPAAVVQTPVDSKLVRTNVGLYADDQKLYCYVNVAKDYGRDVAKPGMSVLADEHIHLDVYETSDLVHWTHYEKICEGVFLQEGPRRTQGGRLLCCGQNLYDQHGMVLVWDDASRPFGKPRVVNLMASPEGITPEEGTWYQTADGRIWLFQRDGSISCCLALTYSDDDGDTWSDLTRTEIPNSYARAFAGQLGDGRHYIVGNNYDVLLNRLALQIALSDDGYTFDRQYTLIEGRTTRRINGRHKEDGYHYPQCCSMDGKLVVVYSVNKEDIEVGVVDMGKVR